VRGGEGRGERAGREGAEKGWEKYRGMERGKRHNVSVRERSHYPWTAYAFQICAVSIPNLCCKQFVTCRLGM
jgi:hypothetical protein